MHKITTHLRLRSKRNSISGVLPDICPGDDTLKNILKFAAVYRTEKILDDHYITIMIN